MIDCGRFAANLDDAVVAAGHSDFPARRAASRQHGVLRGIGVTCFMETARGAPNEGAETAIRRLMAGWRCWSARNPTAWVTKPPMRRSPRTCWGCRSKRFRYVQADTSVVRAGNGHGGARSMHMGGAALCKAIDTMLAKGSVIAARLLQASPIAGRFRRWPVHRAGRSSRGPSICCRWRGRARDPANLPDGADPGLDTYVWNMLDVITFPNGCHIAEVEVDPDTGAVTLQRYTAVDDFGTLINPMLTDRPGAGRRRAGHRPGDAGAHRVRSGKWPDAERDRSWTTHCRARTICRISTSP